MIDVIREIASGRRSRSSFRGKRAVAESVKTLVQGLPQFAMRQATLAYTANGEPQVVESMGGKRWRL